VDNFQRFGRSLKFILFAWILTSNLLIAVLWFAGSQTGIAPAQLLAASVILALLLSSLLAVILGNSFLKPVRTIWQAVLHLSPSEHGVAAPNAEDLRLGREMVASLTSQIYQLTDTASRTASAQLAEMTALDHNFIAQNLPLPLVVLDPEDNIKFANTALADYVGLKQADIISKNVYMVLDMSFPSEDTLDNWLKESRAKSATATGSWERVRLNARDDRPAAMLDLAAYYNRDNTEKIETMLVLFDHTEQYSQDDQAVSFIALSVHELRTPLTLLRGYIEVFEQELQGKIDPELQGFMEKMHSQAEQLMAFVNNILNVARVDNDQLELHLAEADWSHVLTDAVKAVEVRARVRGITLQCKIAPGLPTVGVDRLSIYEVLSNLIDNAIKYSADSKVINIEAGLTKDGLVETTVQDFGRGIPTSIIPNLFTKFYRDHRNRSQIGGTGLGLYLCKAIVTAHGGNLWVRSREGQGSTFGFTLIPYAKLTAEAKQSGDSELVRGAHGWIKNHSLYRR
jgi:signal transduction histidine kinase